MLCFIGSVCAPDTLQAENHALQCTSAGPKNAIPSTLLGFCSDFGLGPFLVGIHSLCPAARYRVAACSITLSQSLEKISTARGRNCTPLFARSPSWEKNSLLHPCFSVPRNKKQKVATGPLLDKLLKQDFAGLLSSRASRVLGPSIRYRVADMLSHMKSIRWILRRLQQSFARHLKENTLPLLT